VGISERILSEITAIRELMWEWDPAGLGDVRQEVPTEYDGLADLALAMVREGIDSHEIAKRLTSQLRQDGGVEAPQFDLYSRIELLMSRYNTRRRGPPYHRHL
jgi:hypothetical protein